MRTIGHIELPLKSVEVVNNQQSIMDIMMDMKVKDVPKALKRMHETDKPQVLVMNQDTAPALGVICYQPIEKWKVNEDQVLLMFVGPSLSKMQEYFFNWFNKSHDPFERGTIGTILNYLKQLEEVQRKKSQEMRFNVRYGSSSTSG